jgi:hypothetical protein
VTAGAAAPFAPGERAVIVGAARLGHGEARTERAAVLGIGVVLRERVDPLHRLVERDAQGRHCKACDRDDEAARGEPHFRPQHGARLGRGVSAVAQGNQDHVRQQEGEDGNRRDNVDHVPRVRDTRARPGLHRQDHAGQRVDRHRAEGDVAGEHVVGPVAGAVAQPVLRLVDEERDQEEKAGGRVDQDEELVRDAEGEEPDR